jgi:hypothetical protein
MRRSARTIRKKGTVVIPKVTSWFVYVGSLAYVFTLRLGSSRELGRFATGSERVGFVSKGLKSGDTLCR